MASKRRARVPKARVKNAKQVKKARRHERPKAKAPLPKKVTSSKSRPKSRKKDRPRARSKGKKSNASTSKKKKSNAGTGQRRRKFPKVEASFAKRIAAGLSSTYRHQIEILTNRVRQLERIESMEDFIEIDIPKVDMGLVRRDGTQAKHYSSLRFLPDAEEIWQRIQMAKEEGDWVDVVYDIADEYDVSVHEVYTLGESP